MAYTASVSKSFQASAMINQQDESGRCFRLKPGQSNNQEKGLSFSVQALLVLATSGMEMCMSFEQIYQVLILQYLGVPLSLVSTSGIFCGVVSMLIVPVVGYVTDRGSNTTKRKMIALNIGLMFFLLGLILLLVCGLIKISSVKVLLQHLADPPSGTNQTTVSLISGADDSTTHRFNGSLITSKLHLQLSALHNATLKEDVGVSVNAEFLSATTFIAIGGFACLDIGYDTSMSVTRAYILENVPKFQHVKILSMATLVQSCSGFILGCLGIFNISDGLERAFGADGIATLLIFFCLFLALVVSAGFMSTILTGQCLTAARLRPEAHAGTAYSMKDNGTSIGCDRSDILSKSDDFPPSQVDTPPSTPLRPRQNGPAKGYSALSSSLSFLNYLSASESCSLSKSFQQSLVVSGGPEHPNKVTSQFLSHNASQVLSYGTNKYMQELESSEKKRRMKQRLTIITVSAFFMVGASLSFTYYAANALTVAIFHGDPLALPGTEGKEMYEKGLRTASLGSMIMYTVAIITSLGIKKILDVLGDERHYLLCNLLNAAAILALVLTQMLELYFLAIVIMGVFRHCLYTLSFAMVNKYSQDTGDNSPSLGKVNNRGKVMSLIGFLFPAHYLIVSIMMAPLLDATGNVWIPLIYCASCSVASAIALSFFYLLK